MTPTRKIRITSKKDLKEGTSQKDGKSFTWKLQQVYATTPEGEEIKDTLKTFADLPLDEVIEVEVEKQDHPEYGVSYMLKKPRQNVSREEMKLLSDRVSDLEDRLTKLEEGGIRQTPVESRKSPDKPPLKTYNKTSENGSQSVSEGTERFSEDGKEKYDDIPF